MLGLAFCGDGSHLVSVGKDRRVRRWHLATGRNTKVRFPSVDTGPACSPPWSLPLVCCGPLLLLPEGARVLRLEVATGLVLEPLEGHYGLVTGLAYSEARMQVQLSYSNAEIF